MTVRGIWRGSCWSVSIRASSRGIRRAARWVGTAPITIATRLATSSRASSIHQRAAQPLTAPWNDPQGRDRVEDLGRVTGQLDHAGTQGHGRSGGRA